VSRDWVQHDPKETPPSPPPARFAPPFNFLKFTELENPSTHSVLRIGTTNNVFLGQNEVELETQMLQTQTQGATASENSLMDYLFYFFFPPPRDCLDGGAEAYRMARVQVRANQNTGAPDLSVRTDCRYAPTLAEFYASQLSSGVEFQVTNGAEKLGGIYRQAYFRPMEKLESNGMTFYVFEAQGPILISPMTCKACRRTTSGRLGLRALSPFTWTLREECTAHSGGLCRSWVRSERTRTFHDTVKTNPFAVGRQVTT
jgi:hypothetical protein